MQRASAHGRRGIASKTASSSFTGKTRPLSNKPLGQQQLSSEDLPVAPQRSVHCLLPPGSVFRRWSERQSKAFLFLQFPGPYPVPYAVSKSKPQIRLFSTGLALQPLLPESACAQRSLESVFFFFFFEKGKGKKTLWLKSRSVKMVLQL